MPSFAIALAAGLLMLAGCAGQIPGLSPEASDARRSTAAPIRIPTFATLVKSQGPAVVNISSTQRIRGRIPFNNSAELNPGDPYFELFKRFGTGDGPTRELRSQSLGSGFIVDPNGHILTSSHVIEGADEVTVTLTDKRRLPAKLVGIDKPTDIALLKIDSGKLPVVTIGDPAALEVGEWVIAIGAPFGFTNSVTQGIVSAKERALPGESIVPFIQTDAAINPGNSGGPLFNIQGEVIGIISRIYSQSGGFMGVSFAVPIDIAMKVKDRLLKDGIVRRGWLGVTIREIGPEYAESVDPGRAPGVLIVKVAEGGPADRAGLLPGDILVQFDGHDIDNADDLVRFVAGASPTANTKMKIRRNRATLATAVVLLEGDAVSRE